MELFTEPTLLFFLILGDSVLCLGTLLLGTYVELIKSLGGIKMVGFGAKVN